MGSTNNMLQENKYINLLELKIVWEYEGFNYADYVFSSINLGVFQPKQIVDTARER